ncbi:MAG: lactate utilization protein [Chloroflexota bacterium]|nr:lactate utilization protein [Chloroflexota bacterium]
MQDRDQFFKTVRDAIRKGKSKHEPVVDEFSVAQSEDISGVERRIEEMLLEASQNRTQLISQFIASSGKAGCKVTSVEKFSDATEYIRRVVDSQDSHLVVRTEHQILDHPQLDLNLIAKNADLRTISSFDSPGSPQKDMSKEQLKSVTAQAAIGLTGVDYAIAETGSCVIIPRLGVSRLVSLLPPIHVAIVQVDQIIPDLDALFLLRRRDFVQGNLGTHMNIITGPSRSADIEYTIVTGVHGPAEVHLLLIDQ